MYLCNSKEKSLFSHLGIILIMPLLITVLPLYICKFVSTSPTVFVFSNNRWALCSSSYYLNGMRTSGTTDVIKSQIEEGRCCRPQNHPNSYEDCYDEDSWMSLYQKGWRECEKPGYYLAGIHRDGCNELGCIDMLRCCKMKAGNYILIM